MKFIRNRGCRLIQTRGIGWVALLVFSFSLLVSPSAAQAARLPGDPLVIIDADVTNQYGPCTEAFQANIGTKAETTTRFSCPAGTLLKSEIVRRSQAVARHEPYVLAPASNASPAEKQRIWQQFQQLDDAKTSAYQQALSKMALHPLVSCGQSGAFYAYWWTDDGTELESYISYYKSLNCGAVAFDTAWIQYLYAGTGSYGCYNGNCYTGEWYWWDYDLYAGNKYTPPGCPFITPSINNRVSHFVGQNSVPGYYYENWIADGCGNLGWHNNIGPIN